MSLQDDEEARAELVKKKDANGNSCILLATMAGSSADSDEVVSEYSYEL